MSERSFVHIGAPKSASTTLQRSLLARHPQVLYFGEDGDGWASADEARVGELLLHADDLFFPAEQCSAQFAAKRAEAAARTVVYSNVDVMGSRRPTTCAHRLHSLMPDAEVIVILRNQFTALASFYANHGAFLKPAPPGYFRRHVALDDWLAWCTTFPTDTPAGGYLYGEILDLYARLWGREKIHLFLFEDFIADPDAFVRRLAKLLDIDSDEAATLARDRHERPRNTARMLAWNRFYSRFLWGLSLPANLPGREGILRAWHRYLGAGAPAKIVIPARWHERLVALYGEGNARISRDYGLDLGRHGYPMISDRHT